MDISMRLSTEIASSGPNNGFSGKDVGIIPENIKTKSIIKRF